MINSRFVKITNDNLENYLKLEDLSRGALIKFRYSDFNVLQYDLDSLDNDWNYGIICDVTCVLVTKADLLLKGLGSGYVKVYDLWIWNITEGGAKEFLGLTSHEIYLVKS